MRLGCVLSRSVLWNFLFFTSFTRWQLGFWLTLFRAVTILLCTIALGQVYAQDEATTTDPIRTDEVTTADRQMEEATTTDPIATPVYTEAATRYGPDETTTWQWPAGSTDNNRSPCNKGFQLCAQIYSDCATKSVSGGRSQSLDGLCDCLYDYRICVDRTRCIDKLVREQAKNAIESACSAVERQGDEIQCCYRSPSYYDGYSSRGGLPIGARVAIGLAFAAIFVAIVLALFMRSINNVEHI